ncbi:DUF1800 domain-containing protein [Paracoccus sp. (in: a-proteobacteria)]|uniref:DUF1800 domain-containing protein n=1 Tax=Paracoccus sp. TaxID=267 RepID=UPI00289727F6|nr:DUF1800 domain-containing protein [Paracoccus sp. (in: a-proteobacteria)]
MEFGFPELAAIRLGYGLSPHHRPLVDADAVLSSISFSAPRADAPTMDEARAAALKLNQLTKAREESDEQMAQYKAFRREMDRQHWRDLQARVARALDDPSGFGERLVQFWADHFTIRASGPTNQKMPEAFVNEAIRPYLRGRFEDMFFAADTHPMMLIYLNQIANVGPNSPFGIKRRKQDKPVGLNENLAREALELHSIGVDAKYSQKDVREFAKLLTGVGYSTQNGAEFLPNRAEPGAETILGKSYGGGRPPRLEEVREIFVDLARHPMTAQYISRKLAIHFLSDTPDEGVVDAMSKAWVSSQGDLSQVYRVMITHPALADSFRQKIRQPFDFIITGLRALGVTGDELLGWDEKAVVRYLVRPLPKMGQRWGQPNGPNGWPEDAEAWITPQALAARINWSLDVPKHLKADLPDPRELMQTTFGGTQSEALAWAIPKAESAVEGVALILASNDLNRR